MMVVVISDDSTGELPYPQSSGRKFRGGVWGEGTSSSGSHLRVRVLSCSLMSFLTAAGMLDASAASLSGTSAWHQQNSRRSMRSTGLWLLATDRTGSLFLTTSDILV